MLDEIFGEFRRDPSREKACLMAEEAKILLEDNFPPEMEFGISLVPRSDFNTAKKQAKNVLNNILLYDQYVRQAQALGGEIDYNEIGRKCGFVKVEVF